jgi:hypothetical protein
MHVDVGLEDVWVENEEMREHGGEGRVDVAEEWWESEDVADPMVEFDQQRIPYILLGSPISWDGALYWPVPVLVRRSWSREVNMLAC